MSKKQSKHKPAKAPAPHTATGMEPSPQEIDALAALFNNGQYTEAMALARTMTMLFPLHGFGWMVLGAVFKLMGQNADALTPMQNAVALSPGNAEAHNNLGAVLNDLGRLDEAEASYRRALEIKPDYAEALNNLGNTLKNMSQLDKAEACFRRALEIKPDYAEAHDSLGNTLQHLGRLDEAEASYQRALEIKPDYDEALNNLGNTLRNMGQLDKAEACFRRALEIKPDYAEALNNLGVTLLDQRQLDEAGACCRRALEIKPDFAEAHYNQGNVFHGLGRLDDAETSYRQALKIKPDFALAYSNLLFILNFQSDVRSDEILALCREYNERFCLPHRGEWQGYANSRDAHRRLRIGYVSPDFRRHAVAYFAEPILANHDKTQVEIFCYAEVMREDEYTGRFRQFADHWYSTVGMSDGAVAQMIRDHRIDILVDLAGHTAGNRLLVFARKPAPIQITYLGYPGTTGLSAMDYRITDHYADPDGVADARYTERLLRLPDSLCCYRPSADMPEVSPLPALERGYLTFGSFNNFNKIDLPTFALWAELLHALPTSRLMMLTVPEGETRLHLEQNFARLGIDRQRLEFYGKLTPAEFHRKFQEVDITLDPVSVSGGTTTCESLWMGVPVMASVGGRFITRVSYSFLSTAGLADFAAFSPVDYIRLATHLADNLPLLAEIRAGLRAHVAASPLIDEVGFTRNLESLYRKAWRKWCGVN